jgi:nucleotide-binding universal stress UspA family protein
VTFAALPKTSLESAYGHYRITTRTRLTHNLGRSYDEITMPIRDILLQLNSHPQPTPSWAVESAAYIAERLEAKLSIGLCEVRLPDVSNLLSELLIRSRELIAAENEKSALNARELRRKFETLVPAERAGESIRIDCPALATGWQLAARARLYDFLIVPVYGHPETVSIAEALIFESGRPVLLLPPEDLAGHRLNDVVVGWDGSRGAARALAEARDLLASARSVTVATVIGDKDLVGIAPAEEVVRHLSRHGVSAEAVEAPLEGGNAGEALTALCRRRGTDLLVMGAFGHTRAREFLLGGATRSALKNPGLPVLMAH